jgi:hypothetical protein
MNDATLTRLYNVLADYGVELTAAGHLVNEIETIVEDPDRTPHGLALCKVCRAPVRDREPIPEPEPEGAEVAKQ